MKLKPIVVEIKEPGPKAKAYWEQITRERKKARWRMNYRTYRKMVTQGI